jgi:hypothetical protein
MSGAVAFLAGLGTGYLNERDRKDERFRLDERERREIERESRRMAREDTADARATENYNFQLGERQRAVEQRTALERAATPDAVTSGEVYQPAVDDEGNSMPANPTIGTAKVGASRFASQGLAQEAALQQANQRVQQFMDVQDPAGRQRRQTEATQAKAAQVQLSAAEAQLKENARKAMNEGVLEALQAAAGGASPEQVKAIYNRNGDNRVVDLQIEPFEFDHPTLGKQRSARIVGKFENGAPLQVQDAFASALDLFGAAKKFDLLGQWARDKAAKDDRKEDNVLARDRFNQQMDLQKQGIQAQRAQLGMQMQAFRAQQKAAEADARIPPAVKMQHQMMGEELKQIGAAITKAMAEDTYKADSQNSQMLMLRQRELTTKASQLLAPYLSGGSAPAAASGGDPLGLFKPPPQAAQTARQAAPPGAARMAAAGVPQPILPQQLAMFDKMPDAELQAYVKAGNQIAAEVARRRAAVQVQVPVGMVQD